MTEVWEDRRGLKLKEKKNKNEKKKRGGEEIDKEVEKMRVT